MTKSINRYVVEFVFGYGYNISSRLELKWVDNISIDVCP